MMGNTETTITPRASVLDIGREHSESQQEPLICSYYVNMCSPASACPSPSPSSSSSVLCMEALKQVLQLRKLVGRWLVACTFRGLLMAFSRRDEANDVLENVNFTQVLGGPTQVTSLPPNREMHPISRANCPGPGKYFSLKHGQQTPLIRSPSQFLVIRDVPWTIPIDDVTGALDSQGIQASIVDRWRQHYRVEVKHPEKYEELLSEGLNFYGVAWFLVTQEWTPPPPATAHGMGVQFHDYDVLQCYRCQGFWHVAMSCRQTPRCVRCGELHGVEFCSRSRENPVCCNCSGLHHAASKLCPVRQQCGQSVPVSFVLSKKRTPASSALITRTITAQKPSCIL